MPKSIDIDRQNRPLVPYLAPPRLCDRMPLPYAALIAFTAIYMALALLEAAAR